MFTRPRSPDIKTVTDNDQISCRQVAGKYKSENLFRIPVSEFRQRLNRISNLELFMKTGN